MNRIVKTFNLCLVAPSPAQTTIRPLVFIQICLLLHLHHPPATPQTYCPHSLASCLIYAQALLEYEIFIMWLRSVIKMLPSVKFAEYKVLTFLILHEKC